MPSDPLPELLVIGGALTLTMCRVFILHLVAKLFHYTVSCRVITTYVLLHGKATLEAMYSSNPDLISKMREKKNQT